MARVSALQKDDRQWLESEIEEVIQDHTSVRYPEVTQEVIHRLDLMASHGDDVAARAILALAADGVYSLVQTVGKKQQGTVRISGTGKVVSVPARVGSRTRDRDGVQLKAYQQTLWYEMAWDDFVAMIASRLQQIAQLSDKVAAFQEVLRYRDMFPESMTPGEALERAGIDPSSIDFDMSDVA